MQNSFVKYFGAVAILLFCIIIGKIFNNFFTTTDQILIYLIGATIVAVKFGSGPSVLFSFLSVITFNFFFVEPLYTFEVANKSYWLTFLVMFVTSLFIANQSAMLIAQASISAKKDQEARQEKTRNTLLSSISHDLRTPLSAIIGASESIIVDGDKLQKDSLLKLAKSINNEAERLTKIVNNLLSITVNSVDNLEKLTQQNKINTADYGNKNYRQPYYQVPSYYKNPRSVSYYNPYDFQKQGVVPYTDYDQYYRLPYKKANSANTSWGGVGAIEPESHLQPDFNR